MPNASDETAEQHGAISKPLAEAPKGGEPENDRAGSAHSTDKSLKKIKAKIDTLTLSESSMQEKDLPDWSFVSGSPQSGRKKRLVAENVTHTTGNHTLHLSIHHHDLRS